MDSEKIKRLMSQIEIEKQKAKRLEIQIKTEKELHRDQITRNENKFQRQINSARNESKSEVTKNHDAKQVIQEQKNTIEEGEKQVQELENKNCNLKTQTETLMKVIETKDEEMEKT